MAKFTPQLVKSIAPRGRQSVIGPLPALLNKYLPMYEINKPKRIALFLANTMTETGGFRALVENLNYSAKRLTQVWPSRFPNTRAAAPFANNPEALANNVYDRYGNKGHKGWGWRYRGRGLMMNTFVDNYRKVDAVIKLGVVANPDMLGEVEDALRAACIFWKENGCNELADQTYITVCRKRINGGTHGLTMVKSYYRKILPLVQDITFEPPVAATVGGGTIAATGTVIATTASSSSSVEGWMIGVIVGLTITALVLFLGWRAERRKSHVKEGLTALEGVEDIPDQRSRNGLDVDSLAIARRAQLFDGDELEAYLAGVVVADSGHGAGDGEPDSS